MLKNFLSFSYPDQFFYHIVLNYVQHVRELILIGEECVMIIGGRDMDTVHEDCYIIHTMDWRVEQVYLF